jgi:hypothetical protein
MLEFAGLWVSVCFQTGGSTKLFTLFGVFQFMLTLKQVAMSGAAMAVSVSVNALYSTPTQAAIVSGQVSGIWDVDRDEEGGFNVGDAFTIDYTYDSDSIVEETESYPNGYSTISRTASLLSLVFKSNNLSQVFDLDPLVGEGFIFWFGSTSLSPEFFGQLDFIQTSITAYTQVGSRSGSLYAYSTIINATSGEPSFADLALGSFSDTTASENFRAIAFDVEFSGATPEPASIPTPALLPGLIGLGVSVLRRRKQADASPEEQQA